MSPDLSQALEELTSESPSTSAPVEVARSAWATGRRRRRTRRFGAVAAVVVAVLAVGFLSGSVLRLPAPVQPADSSGSSVVHGYPERIGHQVWVRNLPAAPGPMSLLMQRVVHRGSYDQPAGWDAVNRSGHRWHLANVYDGNDDYPVLSPDGRYLGYLAGVHGPWVMQDLVSGRSVLIRSVGSGLTTGHTRFQTEGQSPSFWSPDDQHIVVDGFTRSDNGRALLLGLDGTVTVLNQPGFPAGWADDDTIVWLKPSSYSGKHVRATALFLDVSGAVKREVRLSGQVSGGSLSQWGGFASPDARQIALMTGDTATTVRRYSLTTGKAIGRPDSGLEVGPPCGLAWDRSTPVAPLLTGDNVTPELLGASGPRPIVAIDPRLGPACIVWASDALNGTRNDMPFGLSTAWWTWWWREFVVGLLLAGSLTLFGWRWAVVRRRRVAYRGKETGVGAPD